jgi:hypothetical protein
MVLLLLSFILLVHSQSDCLWLVAVAIYWFSFV